MVPHFHNGFSAFATMTIYAIVGINLVRLGAAKLAENPRTERIGKTIGSLVTWR